MAHRVGIVGASGYGGAELVRLLEHHPQLELEVIAAREQAGRPAAELFPNLGAGRRFDEVDLGRLTGLDLVFLATPHGPALQLGAALRQAGTRVVDLSAAFRLEADAFARWYGEEHPNPELAPDGDDPAGAERAVYGLPERFREAIRGAPFVANPGCYPTAALLGLAPLAGLLEPDSIVVDGKSGTSGAGRGVADRLHFSHVHGDVTAYGVPTHRHTGEIEAWLPGDLGTVTFTPHLMPMSRGLLTTAYARTRPGTGADDVAAALAAAYDDEPFVAVLPPSSLPHTKALAGSNGAQVAAQLDERTGRVVVLTAIDNLGKGAAGQALQNANLMLDLPEATALTATGVYP